MDSIKKKMEKLANETAEAEARIAHFEEIKAANEAEAEKFEEQLRNIQKKMQAMESQFDVCTEDLFNQTVKLLQFFLCKLSLLIILYIIRCCMITYFLFT